MAVNKASYGLIENLRIWGDARPRTWSSAIIHISGMSETHTITVDFIYYESIKSA